MQNKQIQALTTSTGLQMQVTQKYIDEGMRNDCVNCPVALAVAHHADPLIQKYRAIIQAVDPRSKRIPEDQEVEEVNISVFRDYTQVKITGHPSTEINFWHSDELEQCIYDYDNEEVDEGMSPCILSVYYEPNRYHPDNPGECIWWMTVEADT